MKKQYLKTVILAAALAGPLNAMGQVATPTHTIQQTFTIPSPDYKLSPYTGMTRQSWIDAAEYLLSGAFTYIRTLDDPMYFPKQLDKAYPNNEGQVPTAKLEGFCRTLFVAAPLLREKPELTLNGIKVADYYRHQLLNLIRPDSPSFIPHRKGGPSQILVEFGALAISLSVAKDILWEPLTQEQKDQLAATMLSYGNGPTIGSNWMFFNVFVISFFKEQGYAVNDQRMKENLEKILKLYRGEGWYNDAPAYDYYSMWAFQMYGPIWAQMYGHFYPEYAAQFMKNQHDLADNYPYMFSAEGKMNMWGRSIPYRFGAVVPLALLGYEKAPDINYGWMRRIASATLLQFLQNPDFLEDNVPTLGFYGTFAPAVQIYSCRGSVYWCGKAFLSLLLPADNPFWTAVENNGPWEKEFKKDHVYNKFQPATNLLITDYPNCGGAEMRSWCHETVANDWQKFRSSENYNKLAYHTEFPWMADGTNGEVSMNYATLNGKNQWEVLRLYTFQSFENGIYRRDAELETNRADFMQVWDYQQWEMRACKFLTDNRRDLKRIPSDTLASFDPVYGRIHFFHPRRDAFEVLKNSGLMSSVPDKDFLLAVTQGYAVLADLEENISMYYQLKLTAQNDMSKDFSEKQRERFYTGDMYERWECIFSVPCFAEFMLTAPYYFPEGYIEGLLADVDRSIRAIEAKYKLDKKPTDD